LFENPIEGSVNVLLKLLAAVTYQELHGSQLRSAIATDAFRLGKNYFLPNGIDAAEAADDVGRLAGHHTPDGAEVHVDSEAIAARKADAGAGNGWFLAAIVQDDLPVRVLFLRSGKLLCVVADGEDVDLHLARIDRIQARRQRVVLNACLAAERWIVRQVGHNS